MQVNITQRAIIALQKADGELKKRLDGILRTLEAGSDLPSEQVRMSHSRPGVFVVKINDYRLFFQRGKDAIQVLDIVPRSEAYQ